MRWNSFFLHSSILVSDFGAPGVVFFRRKGIWRFHDLALQLLWNAYARCTYVFVRDESTDFFLRDGTKKMSGNYLYHTYHKNGWYRLKPTEEDELEMRYQTQRPLTGLQAAGLWSLWAGWLAMACGAFAGSSGKHPESWTNWVFEFDISELVRHVVLVYPIGSMYGIYSCIYHNNQLNVGEYTIHGCYGAYMFIVFFKRHIHHEPANQGRSFGSTNRAWTSHLAALEVGTMWQCWAKSNDVKHHRKHHIW